MRRIWATNGQQKILGPDQIYNNFRLTHATPLPLDNTTSPFSPIYSANLRFQRPLGLDKSQAQQLSLLQVQTIHRFRLLSEQRCRFSGLIIVNPGAAQSNSAGVPSFSGDL